MKLILPNLKYKESYEELIKSARKYGDYQELGNALIKDNETFKDMLIRLNNRRKGKNIAKRDVPATIYWIIDNDKVVGTIDLRHKLNKDYFERLGHIAYYIKPEDRNKGYATKALAIAKRKYFNKYFSKILITCFKDNIASAKVIKKNGGILEKNCIDSITQKEISRYIVPIREHNLIIPKTVWFTTNRNCNNKCNWCYASKCNDKIMNFTDIKKYVNELVKFNITKIILIGGESTIYPDILNTIKYISNKGIEVSLASNGRMFKDFNFSKKMAKAGLKKCNISIKGYNEKEYILNTNSKGFKEMVEGYKNLKKLGINVSTSYVLCDNNHTKFDKFLSSFIENGLDNIVFQLYKPAIDSNNEYNAPTIKELANLCKYVFNKIKDTNIKFSFEMSIPLCCLEEDLLNEMIEKKCITTCCHITKGTGLIFDANFNILPCNHFVNYPLNTNKVMPSQIIKFWNSKQPENFRNTIKTYPHEICEKCEKWSQCGGGCFLRWLSSDTGRYINKKYWKGGRIN